MVRDFAVKATAATLVATWAANAGASGAFMSVGKSQQPVTERAVGHQLAAAPVPAASLKDSMGLGGLLAYGASFGALLAVSRGRTRLQSLRNGELALAPRSVEIEQVSWLKGFPPALMKRSEIEGWLRLYDDADWDNPPEDSELYFLKSYAEAYGEGKATKISFGEWFQFKQQVGAFFPDDLAGRIIDKKNEESLWEDAAKGQLRVRVPVPLLPLDNAGYPALGPWIQWRGKEYFAGDQLQTIITDGSLSGQFVDNWAYYREGLKSWQRGIEIGMAHGYFIIGPFTKLGPLRNTPEAATVGMLGGIFILLVVTCGGLIFGATEKPRMFDEPGKPKASGWQEMMYWHAIGSVGGAGFAHALITIFGNGMA